MTQEDIEASFGTLLHGAGKIALLVLSHMGRDARDRVCFANLARRPIPAGLESLPWCCRSKRRALMEALMGVTFPNESPEYRAARDKLMQREVSLRREMEAVAAEIRALPPGGAVPEDYEFDHIDAKGVPAKVRFVRTVPTGHRYTNHLPLHVPTAPQRQAAGAERWANGAATAAGRAVSILHSFAR